MAPSISRIVEDARGRACSVAHVRGAHGSGKSTVAVPQIWSAVETDASVAMVYIQPTAAQTALLRDFLYGSGSPGLKAGLRSGRLRLWHAPAAACILLRDGAGAIGSRAVVCVDLEVVQTAFGEFVLACLLERAVQLHRAGPGSESLVLVTMGVGSHRFPADVEPFAAPTIIELGQAGQPSAAAIQSHVEVPRAVLDVLRICSGVVVTFLNEEDHNHMSTAARSFAVGGPALTIHRTTPNLLDSAAELRKLRAIEGPAIIHADPAIAVSLPLRNVQAVFCSSERPTRVLSRRAGLVQSVLLPSSAAEHAVRFACGPDARHFVIACSGTPPLPAPRSLAYEAELLLLALLALAMWRAPIERTPLAHLAPPGPARWLDATRQLRTMGLVEATGLAPTPLAARAIGWLAHTPDLRLACFLAHIRGDTPELQKRVMVRLAALIESRLPLLLLLDGDASPALVWQLARGAGGPAVRMLGYGHIWAALSAWEAACRSASYPEDTPEQYAPVSRGLLLSQVKVVLERVLALEGTLGLRPAAGGDMDQQLDPAVLLDIQEALAAAWASNLLWIPQRWDQQDGRAARTFAHHDEIILDTENELVCPAPLTADSGLYAVALDVSRVDDALQAWGTVLIDGRCVRRLLQRLSWPAYPRAVFASALGREDEDDD